MNEYTPALYWYAAILVRAVDGDTYVVNIDTGFDMWAHRIRIRLKGKDTPEPHTETKEAGDAATARVKELMKPGDKIYIHTYKKDSFGRWLADVQLADGTDLGELLLKEGHAVVDDD